MKNSYRKMTLVFNRLLTESKVQTIVFDIGKIKSVKSVESSNYTASGAETVVVATDGKKYKITVEPVR